jgi:hypothetical protein
MQHQAVRVHGASLHIAELGEGPPLKIMRSCLGLSIAAVCVAGAGAAIAGDGPGKGYAQVAQGAYSVVAEVRAKPGKETELRAATLPRRTMRCPMSKHGSPNCPTLQKAA